MLPLTSWRAEHPENNLLHYSITISAWPLSDRGNQKKESVCHAKASISHKQNKRQVELKKRRHRVVSDNLIQITSLRVPMISFSALTADAWFIGTDKLTTHPFRCNNIARTSAPNARASNMAEKNTVPSFMNGEMNEYTARPLTIIVSSHFAQFAVTARHLLAINPQGLPPSLCHLTPTSSHLKFGPGRHFVLTNLFAIIWSIYGQFNLLPFYAACLASRHTTDAILLYYPS